MNSKSFAFLSLLATLTTILPAWADCTFNDGVLTVDGTVDLAGQPLKFDSIKSMTGTGEFTDSVGGGVLTLDVASDVTLLNGKSPCLVKFSGKLKLVKSGEGTLSIANTGSGSISAHSFSGGLEIQSGKITTAKYGKMASDTTPFGDKGQIIDIYPGAILDLGGCYDLASMTINLRGGTLANIARSVGTETYYFKSAINVYAESTFSTDNSKAFNYAGNLNLHENTLKLDFGDTFYWHPSSAKNGKIKVDNGTFLVSGQTDMRTVDLEMNVSMNLKADCSVRDYFANYIGDNTVFGALNVYGSLIPQTTSFYPCTMMDESIIVIPTAGELPWSTANSAGLSIGFDAGATVTIDVGARNLDEGEKLVEWPEGTEYAGRTFILKANGVIPEKYELQVSATGLTVASKGAKVPTATWTGADDGDATNPKNWSWVNVEGDSSEMLPNDTTVVVIPWNMLATLNWPETNALSFAMVEFTGEKPTEVVQLKGDRDWRGLGAVDIPFALDLNGHKLYILLPDAESTVETTVTSSAEGGELHASVAAGKTYDNTMVTLTGNLTLIKEGQGTFVATKYPQEYAGESIVNEGTLRAADGANMNAEDKASPFGATATVTVGAEGVLDPRGSYLWGYHTINLNGGMISNTLEKTGLSSDQYAASTENQFNPTINLTTDSILATDRKFNFQGKFNSNGNRLRIWIASGCTLVWNPDDKTADAADIEVVAGGYLRTFSHGPVKTKHSSLTMTSGYLHIGGVFEVSNYLAASSAKTYKYDSRQASNESVAFLKVYGTFTPQSDNFFACSLQDGSAIDLSGKSGVWSTATEATASSVTSSYKGTKTDVDFAAGATVTIDVGDREFKGTTQIVEWSEGSKASAAEATFVLSAAARAKGYSLSSDENGLYVSRKGMVLLLR